MFYKAVLFDMDGTLLDTLTDIANATNRVLSERGFPTHDEATYRYFVGEGAPNLIEKCLPEKARDTSTISECLDRFLEKYNSSYNENTRLYEGIGSMLNSLTEMGIKLTILSNKPNHLTQLCADQYLSRWTFEKVYGVREGVPRKPDPAGAWDIAKEIRLPAGEFLYLGDTSTDMKTANQAGMRAIGVSWGFHPVEELLKSGAKAIIYHPRELIELLDR
jgi:phosphoglycolate phosphatase